MKPENKNQKEEEKKQASNQNHLLPPKPKKGKKKKKKKKENQFDSSIQSSFLVQEVDENSLASIKGSVKNAQRLDLFGSKSTFWDKEEPGNFMEAV